MKLRKPVSSFKQQAQGRSSHYVHSGIGSISKPVNDLFILPGSMANKFTTMTRRGDGRPSGKGRFGKRPPLSVTIDCGGHSNDNSNDSGLGCDLNSESQFSWSSSEDSQLPGSIIPPFVNSSCEKLLQQDDTLKQSQIDWSFIRNTEQLTPAASIAEVEQGIKVTSSSCVTMSPDSTDPGFSPTHFPHSGGMVNEMMDSSGSLSPNSNSPTSTVSPIPMKRPRFSFPQPASVRGAGLKLRNQNQNQNGSPVRSTVGKRLPPGTTPTLASALAPSSRDGRVQLQIFAQPEEQHRARYQTEGSRGAIKDRKGNGFPTVKLMGYDKPATLQIFIGTDQGKVSPHMFYQACKVTGKSSTPCIEKKVEGTVLIEIEFEPSKEMVISCDCVGILKERNVDVEQRFPFHHASQSRKKSTKCRMIYRTTIVNSTGMEETLQSASLPILCTQPPGLPEICKQSLMECPAKGGLELFIIGKNFLKDTKVVIQEEDNDGRVLWEAGSEPLKDYLQQNHLICVIPAYKEETIIQPVECKVSVMSGGKLSEPHRFTYLPNINPAIYGVAVPSCIANNHMQTHPMISNSMSQPLAHNQLLSVEMQVGGSLLPSGDDSIRTSMVAAASATMSGQTLSPREIPTCSPMTEQHVATSPLQPLQPLPTLPFDTNMIQPTTPQERQVVNELQCILEQSVQQNHNNNLSDAKAREIISSRGLLNIKPENTFPILSLDPNVNEGGEVNVNPGVPLDLQFPIQEQTTSTSTETAYPKPDILNMNSFHGSTVPMSCVTVSGMPHILNSTGISLGTNSLVVQTGHQILPSLMTNSSSLSLAPIAACQTESIASAMVQNLQNVNVNVHSNESDLVVVGECIGQRVMKMKIEPSSPMNLNINPNMNSGVQVQQQAGSAVNVMSFMEGELQPHQGPIANALTQMSENELINYINPSCFDQGSF